MTVATDAPRTRRPSRLLGSSLGELTLRVHGDEHQGRELTIRAAKCTIGSAKGCTVRLAARGIRSLHCWILRGPGGTIVRRRDPRTLLNGRPFSDAPLAPGDRLRLGSVELEVIACPRVPIEWTSPSSEPVLPIVSDFDRLAAERAALESAQTVERLQAELQDLERRTAQQLGELNDLFGHVSSERDDLSQRLQAVEAESASQREQLSLRLRTVETEARSERDALLLDKQQLELTLSSNEQRLAELRSVLGSRESEIESVLHVESQRVAGMQGRLEQVVRERAQIEAHLREQTDLLRTDSLARQAECDRLQGECQGLEMQLAQLRELVGYTAAERDRLTMQLDGRAQQQSDHHVQFVEERVDLQRRLDAALAQLGESERRLAVLQVEGDNHLRTGMEHVSTLQQRLEQAESLKSELEGRLAEQTAAWHSERESLRHQTERVSEHCKQVEGQLVHVRELVESLATERDSLCQQLEAAEIRLESEQQEWNQQRTSLEQQLQSHSSHDTNREQQLAELAARLNAESARAGEIQQQFDQSQQQHAIDQQRWRDERTDLEGELSRLREQDTQRLSERERLAAQLDSETARAQQWQSRAEASEQQLATAGQQLTEAAERFAALRSESEGRLHDHSVQAARLANEADQTRAELSRTQVALADAETRLAAYRTEIENRLQTEKERAVAAERRGDEVSRELAAADVRLADAERRLSAFRLQGDDRLNTELKQSAERQLQLAAAEAALAALSQRLNASESQCRALEVERDAQQAAHQQSKEAAAARWASLQEQMTRLQERLAGEQSRLEAVQAEHKTRLKAEIDRADYRERQTTQHLESLELTRQRLAETESRLAELESREVECGLEGRITERPPSRGEIESDLVEQVEAIRLERETWDGDRQRLEQERQSLSERLVQQQRELEALREQLSTTVAAAGHGSMTVGFAEIEQALLADNVLTEERAAWNADRDRLAQRIAQLEQQLVDLKQFSEGMTLGSEAIAELRSQAQADAVITQTHELRTELDSLHGQLAAALAWRDRYQEVEMSAQQQQTTWNADREQFEQRIANLEQQIASAESAGPSESRCADSREAELPASEPSDANQLAQLQALYEEQQIAVADERRDLTDQRAFLDAAQEELARQRDEFLQSQSEFELRWRDREEALRSKEELLNHQAAELAERLERATARLAELDSECARRAEQHDALDRQPHAAECRENPAPEPGSDLAAGPMASGAVPSCGSDLPPPSEFAPAEQKIVADSTPPDDKPNGEPAASVASQRDQEPEPPAPTRLSTSTSLSGRHSSVWTQPNRPAVAADDDSIEAYMTRLLKRVRGDAPGQPAVMTSAPPPKSAPVAEARPAISEPAAVETPVNPVEPPPAEQFLPRNRSPELNTSLVAMRELANAAARTAIVRHERKSGGKLAFTKAVGAGLTLVCSGVAAYFAYRMQSLYGGIGAAIGFLAAFYWSGKAALQALKTLTLRVPSENAIELPIAGSQAPELAESDSLSNLDVEAAAAPDAAGEQPATADDADAQVVAN